MRELRTRKAALAVGVVLLLGGCRKDAIAPTSTTDFNDFSLKNTPSVKATLWGKSKTVLPFDGQNVSEIPFQITESQFFTTKTLDGRMEGDSLENTPFFSIFFFDVFNNEQTLSLNQRDLTQRLRTVGMPQNAAEERTERIFGTTQCSPTFLVETAERIARTLPDHEEGLYAAEVRKPKITPTYRASLLTRPYKANHWVYGLGRKPQNDIKGVNLTLGVAGSLMARGNSKVEIWLANGNYRQYSTQSVRAVLKAKRGDTEGELLFSNLILGELTEQTVWTLFKQEILPELYREETNWHLNRLFFRHNYLVLRDGMGRVGYTIYDVNGVENVTNVSVFQENRLF